MRFLMLPLWCPAHQTWQEASKVPEPVEGQKHICGSWPWGSLQPWGQHRWTEGAPMPPLPSKYFSIISKTQAALPGRALALPGNRHLVTCNGLCETSIHKSIHRSSPPQLDEYSIRRLFSNPMQPPDPPLCITIKKTPIQKGPLQWEHNASPEGDSVSSVWLSHNTESEVSPMTCMASVDSQNVEINGELHIRNSWLPCGLSAPTHHPETPTHGCRHLTTGSHFKTEH